MFVPWWSFFQSLNCFWVSLHVSPYFVTLRSLSQCWAPLVLVQIKTLLEKSTDSSWWGAEAQGERGGEAHFSMGGLSQGTGLWNQNRAVFQSLQPGIFVQCANCKTIQHSPVLSDYSLGKRQAGWLIINFSRNLSLNHICIYLLQTQNFIWQGSSSYSPLPLTFLNSSLKKYGQDSCDIR